MSALLLGFIIGAAFYVIGGRDSALGDLELPQRLGLVAVVGVVLLLVAMLFSNDAPEGDQQAAQREAARSAPQTAGPQPAEPAAGESAAMAEPDRPPAAAPPETPAAPPVAAAPETAAPPPAAATPPAAVPAPDDAMPAEQQLQCVYSPDSGRCTCLDGRGYLVEVELERCRELATPEAD